MAKNILVKPLISEKAEVLSEGLNQVTFIVNRKANKVEIRKAVEDLYNVTVSAVNTLTMPAKERVRHTRAGLQKGRVSAYKKAIVSLEGDDEINFFEEI
ncbi:MAG: 50S ribosomal protein L23 [Saprospiraceae bacterium]